MGDDLKKKDICKEIERIKSSPRFERKNVRHKDLKVNSRIKKFLGSLKSSEIEDFLGKPIKKYPVTWIKFSQSIEHIYYIMLGIYRDDFGIKDIKKTLDTYTGSEISQVGNQLGQKQGIFQDRITNLLTGIGRMSREMFPILRNIRVIEERLAFYDSYFKLDENWETADLNLKNIWNSFVLGGVQSPQSIFGMAQQIQFTTLPTLFMNNHKPPHMSVKKFLESFGFKKKNPQYSVLLLNALAEKVSAYYNWLDNSYHELMQRKKFLIQDLRRHYNVLKLNIDWLLPYLKVERRLGSKTQRLSDPEILSFIDQMLMEMEIVARIDRPDDKKIHDKKEYKGFYFVSHFDFRTRPQATQGGQVTHVGRTELIFNLYEWTDEQYEAYLLLNDVKNFELVGGFVDQLNDIFNNYKEELELVLASKGEDIDIPGTDYIKEDKLVEQAGLKNDDEDKKDEKKDSIIEPFIGVFKGGFELINAMAGGNLDKETLKKTMSKLSGKTKKEEEKEINDNQQSDFQDESRDKAYAQFNIMTELYKKKIGLISWAEIVLRD